MKIWIVYCEINPWHKAFTSEEKAEHTVKEMRPCGSLYKHKIWEMELE